MGFCLFGKTEIFYHPKKTVFRLFSSSLAPSDVENLHCMYCWKRFRPVRPWCGFTFRVVFFEGVIIWGGTLDHFQELRSRQFNALNVAILAGFFV